MAARKSILGLILLLNAIVLTTNGFIGLLRDGGARQQGLHNAIPYSGILNVLPVISACAVIVLSLALAHREINKIGRPFKAMVLWIALTCLWAPERKAAILGVLYLASIPATGMLILKYIDNQSLYKSLALSTLAIGASCVIACIAFPSYGIAIDVEHDGLWQGIFTHKNGLGMYAATAIAALLAVKPHGRPFNVLELLSVGLHLVLLYKSGSSTSLLAVILMAPAFLAAHTGRPNYKNGTARMIGLVAGFAVIVNLALTLAYNQTNIYPLVPDSMLSRLSIWSYGWDLVESSPYIGLGANQYSFLNERGYSDMEAILGYAVGSSHNGSLEVLVSYGVIGIAIYAIFMSAEMYKISLTIGAERAILFWIMFATLGISESVNFGFNMPFLFLSLISFVGSRGRSP